MAESMIDLLKEHESLVIRRAEGSLRAMELDEQIAASRLKILSREQRLNDALRTLIDQMKTLAQHANIETGVCCCGSEMEGHSVYDGHGPRDEGEYYFTSCITAAEEALHESEPILFRHLKSRGVYEVLGTGTVQTARPLGDDDHVVVYKGEDGRLWVRDFQEFHDGRFEECT